MKVLAGLLHTPQGEAALDRAASEAKLRDGELHVVAHVRTPTGASDLADYVEERKQREADLEKQTKAFEERGIPCVGHFPDRADSPAGAILTVAREEDVDLIVIGLRRRSRVGKLVLGSNAQDILLGAECAVLGVKAPKEARLGSP